MKLRLEMGDGREEVNRVREEEGGVRKRKGVTGYDEVKLIVKSACLRSSRLTEHGRNTVIIR